MKALAARLEGGDRALPLKVDVRFSTKDKEALSKELRERFDKDWTEWDSANERAFKAFGLLPTTSTSRSS